MEDSDAVREQLENELQRMREDGGRQAERIRGLQAQARDPYRSLADRRRAQEAAEAQQGYLNQHIEKMRTREDQLRLLEQQEQADLAQE